MTVRDAIHRKLRIVMGPQTITKRVNVDWLARCVCGHYRYEHHDKSFGCMQWDERRLKGWCECDGFRIIV